MTVKEIISAQQDQITCTARTPSTASDILAINLN
jgi:hypothetical protein